MILLKTDILLYLFLKSYVIQFKRGRADGDGDTTNEYHE